MTTLTPQAIARYAAGAGATGTALATAVAIALAESGGRVEVVSPRNRDGTYDRGLWQINDVHTQYDRTKLVTDPAYNAQAAAEVSGGWTNFHPWTVFNSGAYKAHLGEGESGAAQVGSSGGPIAPIGHLGVSAGGVDLPNPLDVPGAIGGAIGDFFGGIATGWVKDLGGVMLEVFLVVVFTAASFALIGVGIGRLSGRNPVDVFNKVAGTAQTAGSLAAAAAI